MPQRWDTDVDTQACLECGSHVTPEFRRGYGDERDRVHRCPECDTYTRLSEGSAAGKDVDIADPLDDPTRFNVTLNDLDSNVRALCLDDEIATDGGREDGR